MPTTTTKKTKRGGARKNSGGARAGAGRPSLGAQHETSVLLTSTQHATALRLGGGKAAPGIRIALDAQAQAQAQAQAARPGHDGAEDQAQA